MKGTKMKKTFYFSFFILLLLISGVDISFSQPYTVRGNVSNLESGDKIHEALISITPGTKNAKSDANGDYIITDVASGTYKIICSYPTLKVESKEITLNSDMTVDFMLSIQFSTETIEINRAIDRETPVAFTDITKQQIEENTHGQDAPMLARGTPGLYSYSTDGVGNGESQLLIRGFNQNYVQVLINGIPTNDPESNSVYWSNWGSVSANAGSIQIQRGAGSSLYGSGGFGGSFNILTNNPLKRFYGATLNLGSPMNTLYGLKLNTGLLKNKTSAALNVERKVAEGTRISGRYEGINYYLSGMFYPNAQQSLQLNLHGAPQEHGYSFSNNIIYFKKFGYTANPAPFLPRSVVASFGKNKTTDQDNYGLIDGSRELVDNNYVNLSANFFHKPQLELHYNMQTNPVSFLKGTFFYSLGRGAGSSMNSTGTLFALSNNRNNIGVNGMKRDTLVTNFYGPEGFVTNDSIANAIYLRQTSGPTLSAYQRISYSLHRQFGILGSYKTEFGKHVNFTGGAEFRSWRADHPGHFVNLFSKDSITAQQYSFRDTAGNISTSTFRRANFQGDLDGPESDVGSPFGWDLSSTDPTYRTQYRNYLGETPQLTLFAQGNFIFDKLNILTSLQYVWYNYKLTENMPSEGAIGQQLTSSQVSSLNLTQEGPVGDKFYMRGAGTTRWYEFNLVRNERSRGFFQPKVGVNYNITKNFNTFVNFAHVERFVDLGIYYNQGNLNPDAKDEKSNQFEAGFGWNSNTLSAKVNGYYMIWENKSSRIQDISKAGFPGYDRNGFITQLVGESEHKGIEFQSEYSLDKILPTKGFYLKGSLSFMENKWTDVLPEVAVDPGTGKRRPFNTGALNSDGNVDTLFFDELTGTPVASGPQFIFSLGAKFEKKGFFVGLDVNYYAKDYLLDGGTYLATDGSLVGTNDFGRDVFDLTFGDVLPKRAILDGQIGYNFKLLKTLKGLASIQVLNILDNEYLAAADRFGVIPGMLRTFRFNLNLGL